MLPRNKFKMAYLPKLSFLLCILWLGNTLALPETIKIGGLFDIWDRNEETAFRHAVQRVNSDSNILPRSSLSAQLERLPLGDSFHASKKVCQIFKEGVAGVIGPQTPTTSSHVQSVCDSLEVPHIETKWDFRSNRGNFVVNLHPHPATLSRAYADLIEAWGWNRYVIIYENNESLIRLQDILRASNPDSKQVIVKQLPPGEDYRPLFKEIRMQADIDRLIIDCDSSKLPLIFQHANEVAMMRNYRYFISSLDIQTLDLDSYLFGDINITAFRMIDRDHPNTVTVLRAWQTLVESGFQDKYSPPDFFVDETFMPPRNRHRPPIAMPSSRGNAEPVPPLPHGMLKTETALIYDAIELYARALQALDTSQRGNFAPQSLNCNPANPTDTWKQGHLLLDALKKVQFQGLTGFIQLDGAGYRSNFQLDIMELTQKGLSKVGVWDSRPNRNKEHFTWVRSSHETLKIQEEDLKNRTLKVSTKLSPPYLMKTNGTQYEGYGIDLLDLLSESLSFKYIICEVKDGGYGAPNNKSKYGWTGVVGEILGGVADLGIGDMTITHDREKTLDFTMPFMNLGISILYRQPDKQPPSLFSFLAPFHYEVWIYMATAYLGVSLILFVLARIAPYEWQEPPPCSKDAGEILENQFSLVNSLWFAIGSLMAQGCDILPKLSPYEWLNPHPCVDEPEELELQLHLPNSLWFTIGSLMQQGSDIAPKITPYQWLNPHPCKDDPDELENDLNLSNAMWHNWGSLMQQGSDIAPKAASTRTVAGIWWFFTLIMISSYTANLAAFLTSEGMDEGIKDIKDLPKQNKVKYGSIGSGSTFSFFQGSSFPLYKEIFNNMQNMRPSPYVTSNPEGVDRVRKEEGRYAFFMESSSIEYQTERDCSLTMLGGPLDSKGYGIALRKNSKYRDAFNSRILELQEKGELEKLKVKWWKSVEKGGGKCNKAQVTSSGGAQPLTLGHVGGVFVVLLGGCGLACVMAFIEFLWKSRKLAQHEGESFTAEIVKELRFALQCQGDTKPVRKPKNPGDPSVSGSVPYLAFDRERREPSS